MSLFEDRLKMINLNCLSYAFNPSKQVQKIFISELKRMVKNQYVSDPTRLLPLFKASITKRDGDFAKLVLSKIDVKNKENVMKFVTTQVSILNDIKGENVIHFAAKHPKDDAFIMQLLFDLIESAGINLNEMLLNEDIILNAKRQTPLTTALRLNKPKIAEFILSKIKDKTDRMKFIEIESIYNDTVTRKNYKNKAYESRYNVIVKACLDQKIDFLKILLKDCSKKDIKRIMENKDGEIYFYLRPKSYDYIHNTFKLKATFKQFSRGYSDGNTPFMQWAGGKTEFVEKILDLCKNNEERLKLIYQCNDDGESALTKANSKNQSVFMKLIKSIISSTKKFKNLDLLIPIFLFSLRVEKIDLAKWLLSKLSISSNKRKLIYCQNEFGLNGVLMACKFGKYASLKFLLDHSLFDSQSVFAKDSKGRSAIHYCFGVGTNASMSCFKRILSCYQQAFGADVIEKESLLFMKDKNNQTPMDYTLKKGLYSSNLLKWAE